jgi:hypothetical protein
MSAIKPILKIGFKRISNGKNVRWGPNDIRIISPRETSSKLFIDYLTKSELGGIESDVTKGNEVFSLKIIENGLYKRRKLNKPPPPPPHPPSPPPPPPPPQIQEVKFTPAPIIIIN